MTNSLLLNFVFSSMLASHRGTRDSSATFDLNFWFNIYSDVLSNQIVSFQNFIFSFVESSLFQTSNRKITRLLSVYGIK